MRRRRSRQPTERLSKYIDPNRIEAYLLAHEWVADRRTDAFSIWESADTMRLRPFCSAVVDPS